MAVCNEFQSLRRVALRHARDVFQSRQHIERQWHHLNYREAPDFARAVDEYDRFAAIFRARDIEIVFLPMASDLSLDAVYVRDASIRAPNGVVLCNMGKSRPTTRARCRREVIHQKRNSHHGLD